MNELLFFCTAILFSSAVFGAVAFSASLTARQYRHWPMLWGTALSAIVISSLLATLFFTSPALNPSESLNLRALNASLGPVEIIEWTTAATAANQQRSWPNTSELLIALYLLGVIAFLLRLVNGRLRASRIASQAKFMTSAQGVEYWQTPQDISPFVIRLFRGDHQFKIVIPESLCNSLSDNEVDQIIRHEIAHINRRDDEFGLLLRVLLAVTWFTPVAHLLFLRWAQSIELLCDQDVVQNTPTESRRTYAKTLLKTMQLATADAQQNRVYHYPVASFSSKQLQNEKMRLEKILLGHYASFKGLAHRLVTICVAAGLSLGSAVAFSANTNIDCVQKKQPLAKTNAFPLKGRITSVYGTVPNPFKQGSKRDHKGVDIAAPLGTTIHAPQDAVILAATNLYNDKPNYGKVVVLLTRDGVQTLLAHLDDFQVLTGQRVQAGNAIATVGTSGASTGPHVHIETYRDGERVNPLTVWNLVN